MSRNMHVNSYSVSSIREFDDVIQHIVESRQYLRWKKDPSRKSSDIGSPLWFRGHERSIYNLLPALFRKYDMDDSKGAFGVMHLREDYRYQAFQARAQHRIRTNPTTRMDWLEIMQHHFMGTRLMDWSESAYIGLSFALDPYLDPTENDDTKRRRQIIDPVVWVIDPASLNEKVYDAFANSQDAKLMIKNALDDSVASEFEKDRIARLIHSILLDRKSFFRPDDKELSLASSGIVSLSAIEAMRQGAGAGLRDKLLSSEFNPYFYLIARYYCDGVPVALQNGLPPIATMHPYHSDRIEVQHGAFTCFPYYDLDKDALLRKKYLVDPRAMEEQPNLNVCLYEICITNPVRIAAQLLESGMHISHIYPDLDRFAKDLEASNFHV